MAQYLIADAQEHRSSGWRAAQRQEDRQGARAAQGGPQLPPDWPQSWPLQEHGDGHRAARSPGLNRISVQVAFVALRLLHACPARETTSRCATRGGADASHQHRTDLNQGERGQRYRVHFEGSVLIEDCWNPERDACRALVVRGLAGRLEVWRLGADYPGLVIRDIGAAAFRTVRENEKMGPRFGPWTPHPENLGPDAVCRSPLHAPAAELVAGGGRHPLDEIGRPASHRVRLTSCAIQLGAGHLARPITGGDRRPPPRAFPSGSPPASARIRFW
jgi:hypothetical protein